jgi:hypothetical protein
LLQENESILLEETSSLQNQKIILTIKLSVNCMCWLCMTRKLTIYEIELFLTKYINMKYKQNSAVKLSF